MNITNSNARTVDVKVGPGGSGGGPEDWRTLGPGETVYYQLSANTLWQVESRLPGSQLISKTTAACDDDIQLVISGARVRPQVVAKEPMPV